FTSELVAAMFSRNAAGVFILIAWPIAFILVSAGVAMADAVRHALGHGYVIKGMDGKYRVKTLTEMGSKERMSYEDAVFSNSLKYYGSPVLFVGLVVWLAWEFSGPASFLSIAPVLFLVLLGASALAYPVMVFLHRSSNRKRHGADTIEKMVGPLGLA